MELPDDFVEFLRSLNDHDVEYLLVGGLAVAIHGYPRATKDMDVWVATSADNANRLVETLTEFGFDVPELNIDLFTAQDKIVRLGVPPVMIEIMTSIDGVDFETCQTAASTVVVGDVTVPVISLSDLRRNKLASGRARDIADLEQLPEHE